MQTVTRPARGIPRGGTVQQQLTKTSNLDWAVDWERDNPPQFAHPQPEADSVWTIIHNLQRIIPVTTVGTDGTVLIGSVRYPDLNRVTVTFGSPQAGIAYLGSFAAAHAPGAPPTPVATPGNASATVDFTPPNDDGGSPITGYTVTAHDLTNPNRGEQTSTGSTSPLTLTLLTNGDQYTFTVHASNAVGAGSESSASEPPVTCSGVLYTYVP